MEPTLRLPRRGASAYVRTFEYAPATVQSLTAVATVVIAAAVQEYTLLEFLGEGSTAHVYLAERRNHESSESPRVAIKVIDKLLVRHAQLENKIQQEMVLHAQLQHPNILRVHEVFEDARNYYMVLEFCERRSIAAMVKALSDRKLDEQTAKNFFYEIVSGVAYLHAHGVLHRDLKLANLLLTEDYHVRISDFGLATRTSGDNMTICGTPNFIAPEILANDAAYSEAVDMWSLGCILYCFLLGKAPFEGRKVSETLANVANANSQELVFAEGFSASAGDLIKRLLTSDPSRRPSAEQVLLHPWLREFQKRSVVPTAHMQSHHRPDSSQASTEPSRNTKFVRERVGAPSQQPAPSRKLQTKPKMNRKPNQSTSRNSKFPRSQFASRQLSSSSSNSSDVSDISSDEYDVSISSVSGLDAYNSDEEEESYANLAEVDQAATGLEKSTVAQVEAEIANQADRSNARAGGVAAQVPRSNSFKPVFESYVSLILYLELQDVPALGIDSSTKASVKWTCVESSEVGLLPKFLLEISNGLEVEYSLSSGVFAGKSADGSALRHEFGSLQDHHPQGKSSKSQGHHANANPRTDHKLRVLVRLSQCLALRSMQLRKLALQLEAAKLPMVHYDTLPESLLSSFREENLDTILHRSLTVDQEDFEKDDCQLEEATRRSSAEIAGVGRGYLDRCGDLRIVFLDGSELTLDSDGSRLRFQPSKASSADEFQLLTSCNASAFLPSAVKKRLESFVTRVQPQPKNSQVKALGGRETSDALAGRCCCGVVKAKYFEMKSALQRNIEGSRKAEPIDDDSKANDSLSATVAPAMESTSEQLAELKLLSRVEHVVSPSAPSSTLSGDEESDDSAEHKQERHNTGRVEKKSMFTALLGTTKKATVNQPTPGASSSTSPSSGLTSSSPTSPKSSPNERFRRASTLPTLCEESFEEACVEGRHRDGDLDPDDDEDNDTQIPEQPTGSRTKGDYNSSRRCGASHNEDDVQGYDDDDAADGEMLKGQPEDSDVDDDEQDEVFAHMLSQLPRDFELLTLSVSDLTVRRLDKVRAAFTFRPQPSIETTISEIVSDRTEERTETSEGLLISASSMLCSVSKMRQTRTLIAVDTIRMLFQRYGQDEVSQAITRAVRRVFQRYALENGIEPLAQAPVVITSANITRIALDARRMLATRDRSSQSSNNNSHHRKHCNATLSIPMGVTQQQQLWSPSRSRPSGIVRNPSSPNQSRSPRGATLSSSSSEALAGNSSCPLTPRSRSILASEGAHVLLQEKISAFQYRGSGGSRGLSAFKVRQDGIAKVEAAAMRRQRSIAYGNEQTRKPPMK